ncbi:hypothetical protein BJX99DRAFT_248413 [Aspergillus californicus]
MPKDTSTPTHAPSRKSPYANPKKKTTIQPREKDDQQNQVSINDLKRRIRDVKRLLNKPDLPADARILQERALKGYEKEMADEEKRRERSKLIKKYHFVRFLDRKTANKELARLSRKRDELSSNSDMDSAMKSKKLEELEARIYTAQVNVNYTIYYPLTEKYISIYAEKKKDKQSAEDADADQIMEDEAQTASGSNSTERKAMWDVVERCMKDGTLDRLREGKLDMNASDKKSGDKTKDTKKDTSNKKDTKDKKAGSKEKPEKTTAKPNRAEIRKANDAKYTSTAPEQEEADDSDGGFFEM